MKNKLWVVLITICLVLSSSFVFAATLSDIKGTKYETAVNNLVNLGIINGYEDNTYKSDRVVTRAEMAKILVIALGKEGDVSAAEKSTSNFKDMKKEHWAYGYVNVASKENIIKGYPDGTFGPSDTVTYAEAVTMAIRALGYGTEVEKSGTWPINYLDKANNLLLLKNINSASKNNGTNGAIRGDVALLLWDTLRTEINTITSENSSGVIYGKGDFLLNSKMSKYKYIKEGLVTKVTTGSSTSTITIKDNSNTNFAMQLATKDAIKLYGKKVTAMYDKNNKEVIYIEELDSSDTLSGDITKLTSTKIYISGGKSAGYTLPNKSNIFLYDIDNLSEAVSAYLVFNGLDVEYVAAFGPDERYYALVYDNDVTVSKKDGIQVINMGTTTKKSYVLHEDSDIPDEKSFICYYINSDNELIILENFDVLDGYVISSVSKTSIKFNSKTYSFSTDDEDYIVISFTGTTIKKTTLSTVDDDYDLALAFTHGEKTIILIFVDGADELDYVETDLNKAKSALQKVVTSSKKLDEATYTESSYKSLTTAITAAEKALNASKPTLSSINTAKSNLDKAVTNLVKASSSEKLLIQEKIALRELIEDCDTYKTNKSLYTTTSYNNFSSKLSSASSVLSKSSSTRTQIIDAREVLEDAIRGLVLISENENLTKARQDLAALISSSQTYKSNQSDYTEASFAAFDLRLTEAKNVNQNSLADINNAILRLNNAIAGLVTKESGNLLIARQALTLILSEAATIETNEDLYTSASYTLFNTDYISAKNINENSSATSTQINTIVNKLRNTIDNKLVLLSKALKDAKDEASGLSSTALTTALGMPESTAAQKEAKITAILNAIKEYELWDDKLADLIEEFEDYTSETWPYSSSYVDMLNALNTIKLSHPTSLEQIKTAYNTLNVYVK